MSRARPIASRRPRSLLARLLVTVLGLVMLGGTLAVVSGYLDAVHETDELFDAQLAQTAQTLGALGRSGGSAVAEDAGLPVHEYQAKLVFQIWHEEGSEERGESGARLVLRSDNAPHERLPVAGQGFSDAEWQGRPWRFFGLLDRADGTHVLVGQDMDIRGELARYIAVKNLTPFLVGLPLLAILLVQLIRREMRPLRQLAQELSRRAPDRLDAVALADPPSELEPVLGALERLFGQVGAALDNERRFTADAAHELRTPLAALRAQLQVAQRTPDAAERLRAFDNCLHGIDRMTHLVEQLLTLARVEGDGPAPGGSADLAQLVAAVCADQGPAAIGRRLALQLDAPASAPVRGLPELLGILARNLVDNAVRYTPRGGAVRVAVRPAPGEVVLEVNDDGPGVPAQWLGELGQRFRRFDETGADGVGLGLSIVRRIADLHGARLAFAAGPDGRGLAVTVAFPAG